MPDPTLNTSPKFCFLHKIIKIQLWWVLTMISWGSKVGTLSPNGGDFAPAKLSMKEYLCWRNMLTSLTKVPLHVQNTNHIWTLIDTWIPPLTHINYLYYNMTNWAAKFFCVASIVVVVWREFNTRRFGRHEMHHIVKMSYKVEKKWKMMNDHYLCTRLGVGWFLCELKMVNCKSGGLEKLHR